MADDWKSQQFRLNVVQKVVEYLRSIPNAPNAQDFEENIFRMSHSKEEYMSNWKLYILNVQKSGHNNPQLSAAHSNQDGQPIVTQPGQVVGAVPAKTAALANTQQANVQLGTVTNQPMMATVNPQGELSKWQVSSHQMGDIRMMTATQKQAVPVNISHLVQAGKVGSVQMNVGQMASTQMMAGVGNQIRRPCQPMQHVPSPGFTPVGVVSGPPRQPTANQMGGSPLTSVSTQGPSGMQPSPAFVASSGNVVLSPAGVQGRTVNVVGTPSPCSAMINTPGQPQQNQQPSPLVNTTDEEFEEKVRKLKKYLPSLRNLKHSNFHIKMKRLVDCLENPSPTFHIDISTLDQCLRVLQEKIELPKEDGPKESPEQILFQAVSNANKAPNGHHIIYSTISPAIRTLSGTNLVRLPPRKKKKVKSISSSTELHSDNYVIQSEVARLSPKFKINLDNQQSNDSDDIKLVCQLDDVNLPCVPPITLILPSKYPEQPPQYDLPSVDYNTTDFLKCVRDIMLGRQKHLPRLCALTMLLDTWETSIRQACSPDPVNADAIAPFQIVAEL